MTKKKKKLIKVPVSFICLQLDIITDCSCQTRKDREKSTQLDYA